jgi:hypothetical protein
MSDEAAYTCPRCVGQRHDAYFGKGYDHPCPKCKGYGYIVRNFEAWYNDWMRMLARNHTRAELTAMLTGTKAEASRAARSHLNAVEVSHSMGGQSMRRAHTRNVTAAAGDKAIAIRGALEIYDLFPQHTKEGYLFT